MKKTVPFDSITLASVVAEIQPLVGARVQKIVQPDDWTVALALYAGQEVWLLLSAHPDYARMHLISRRPSTPKEVPHFCRVMRDKIDGASVVFVRQRGLDRIVEVGLQTDEDNFQLVGEFMGKHSNLMLVDSRRTVVVPLKKVDPNKSRRPVSAGRAYEPPPFDPKPSILTANPGDNLREFEGWSPFLDQMLSAGLPLPEVVSTAHTGEFSPSFAEGFGAYPFDLTRLHPEAVTRDSISQALEQHFETLVQQRKIEDARRALQTQVGRVLEARQRALADIDLAEEQAANADKWRIQAELLLAYQGQVRSGDTELDAFDYEGQPIRLALDPKLTAVENAEKLFRKVKKAKAALPTLAGQKDSLNQDALRLQQFLDRVREATRLSELNDLRDEADQAKWLHTGGAPLEKVDRPYEGHAVRELLSPSGWTVLYGTNATANDYITSRVAKPDDWWLHVRGQTSAHVVLRTGGKPDKVQRPDLVFAAQIAVRNSVAKHQTYVPVDYTLKKYVRKPRKSAVGFATYTREKTLYVDP